MLSVYQLVSEPIKPAKPALRINTNLEYKQLFPTPAATANESSDIYSPLWDSCFDGPSSAPCRYDFPLSAASSSPSSSYPPPTTTTTTTTSTTTSFKIDPRAALLKPFSCTICKVAFMRKHDLVRHERIHDGSRPFKCNHCGKLFSRKDGLRRHENVDKVTKKIRCSRVFVPLSSYNIKEEIQDGIEKIMIKSV